MGHHPALSSECGHGPGKCIVMHLIQILLPLKPTQENSGAPQKSGW